MRLRNWTCCTLAALAFAALPVRAQDARPTTPTIALRVKSFDGLLTDLKYVANLAGQEEHARQFEGMIQALAGPKGLAGTGIDTQRPFGLYGVVTPGGVDSYAVVLVPVADPKAFTEMVTEMVGRFGVTVAKGDDGIHTVSIPNAPVEAYFTFADRYAYVTAKDKDALSPAKRLAPAKLLPADDTALAALTLRIDQIPDMVKQIALGQMEVQMAAAKDKKEPNETPAQTRFKAEAVDYVSQQIKTLFTDGQTVEAKFTIDRKTDDFGFQVSLTGKPGSALAKEIAALGERSSRFGGMGDLAFRVGLNLAVPAELRGAFAAVIDEGISKELDKEKDPAKKDVARKVFETAIGPALKAGRLDLFAGLRGPNAGGHFTAVAALRVPDGKAIERLVKEELLPKVPEHERAKIKLDAETIAGTSVHRVEVGKEVDAEGRRIFGDNAALLAAFPKDAVVIALGADAAGALRSLLEGKSGRPVPPFALEASVARLAPLDKNKGDAARKVVDEVFGSSPGGADMVRVSLEGGPALRFRVGFKGKLITFGVKAENRAKDQ